MPFAEGTPTAEVTLAGKVYTLGFTLGALRRCRELGVLKLDVQDQTAFMLALPEYVWACLSEIERGELTVDGIGELMNSTNMAEIADAVGKLWASSIPKGKSEKNAPPAAVKKPTAGSKKDSTSISSGQSASTISA